MDCETHRCWPLGNRRVHFNDHRSVVFELNRADSGNDATDRAVRWRVGIPDVFLPRAMGQTHRGNELRWSLSIWYQYQRILPRHPDPVAGRIYPLNVHGIVVYQTLGERDWLDEIQYSSIAVFVASALMAAIHEKKFGGPLPGYRGHLTDRTRD